MRIGIVSGYFNPLHLGHLEYINGAKDRCDKLICIVNNDHQVTLKGSQPFMDEKHRLAIVANLKSADEALLSIDTEKTQCETLKLLRRKYPNNEMIFFNSGDRKSNPNSPEAATCHELDIARHVLDLPKIYSSSELLRWVKNPAT